MTLITQLHNLFKTKKEKETKTRRETEVRQYAQDAIKTYKKTLRKLAHE